MKRFLLLFSFSLLTNASASTPEGLPGDYSSPSAQTLEHGRFSAGVTAFGHSDESMVQKQSFLFANPPDTISVQDIVSAGLKLHFAMGLGGNFDFGMALPFYTDLISEPELASRLSGSGMGDLSLMAKLRAPLPIQVFSVALAGGLTVPSRAGKGFLPKGSELVALDTLGKGLNRNTFSTRSLSESGLAIVTLDLTKIEAALPLRFNLSAGLLHERATLGGDRLQWNGSFSWLPTPALGFFSALSSQTLLKGFQGFQSFAQEDMRLTSGVSFQNDDGFFVNGGVQFAVSNRPYYSFQRGVSGDVATYKAHAIPNMALTLQVGWSGSFFTRDRDSDGIPDKIDACPSEAEDFDGFQDGDGCPEPDNDEDGVCDPWVAQQGLSEKYAGTCKNSDKCPGEAEDKDGFQDEDGCPEPDNDQDGILDSQDKCPNDPEDKDGYEDGDGCPDLDNDQDGILDSQDKCPNDPEDKDGFEDEDGCPDSDNDKDGVCDPWVIDKNQFSKYQTVCRGSDHCPDQAQGPGGVDGCPATNPSLKPVDSTPASTFPRKLNLRVNFQGNGTVVSRDSYSALDTLADALLRDPRLHVEIRVYTDNQGSEKASFSMTQNRAEALRKYLVSKGVDKFRVFPRGMGSQNPVASNRTAQGRQQNRRVEVVRIN